MKTWNMKIFFVVLSLFVLAGVAFSQNRGATVYLDPDWGTHPFKAGDGLLISTLPDSNSIINGVYPIDDRGYVELPIIGKIPVTQMTIEEFVALLKKNFISYLRSPNIYVKPLVRVSLLGGFARPGLYYVDIHNSLWDLIHLAGGTLQEDGIYKMHWQRNEEDKSDDLVRYFENGTSLKKMGFKSGDIFWTQSPNARTFWDKVRDFLPIVTFATTAIVTYYTIRQQEILIQAGYVGRR